MYVIRHSKGVKGTPSSVGTTTTIVVIWALGEPFSGLLQQKPVKKLPSLPEITEKQLLCPACILVQQSGCVLA